MKPTYLLLSLFAATVFSTAGFAAGSSSDGDDAAPTATETTTKCKKTEIYDKKLKKCVELKKSGMNEILDDDALYDTARELAYFDRPEDAIVLLQQMADQNQPRVQNYLGFANRKAGRMEDAMMYYNAALAMDPDYVLARSYMGQGLVQIGDISGAKAQLIEIKKRAGVENRPYEMLASAIAGIKSEY